MALVAEEERWMISARTKAALAAAKAHGAVLGGYRGRTVTAPAGDPRRPERVHDLLTWCPC
ncbi:hypothetical protein [Methylobacterium mesophilicum]|uniref:hypothetical protein n=1 Tax=Methylobacterium mesophilicum TaxID=39956 RepID=UPI0039EB43F3